MFTVARPVRAYEDVVNQIRHAIVSGTVKRGDRLPPQRELQKLFGVSRAVVLEALRVLEQIGLVEIKRGSSGGVFVTDLGPEYMISMLSVLLESERVSQEEFIDFRLLVEGQNAYWAAQRASEENLQELQQVITECQQMISDPTVPFASLLTRDVFFHTVVARAAQNRLSLYVMRAILGTLNERLVKVPPSTAPLFVQHFEAVRNAIVARDPEEARRAMIQHILVFTEFISEKP